MKILQFVPLAESGFNWDTTSFADKQLILDWDPARLTGITEIYFKCKLRIIGTTTENTVQLYDLDTLDVLGELVSSDASYTWKVTADIKANFTTARKIGFRAKISGGPAGQSNTGILPHLLVYQDDATQARKSETRVLAAVNGNHGAQTTMQDIGPQIPMSILTGLDGTVVYVLQGSLGASASRTIDLDIYDYTVNEVVSNSTVQVTTTTPLYFVTGSLTLDPTHTYAVRAKLNTGGAQIQSGAIYLCIRQTGFQKITAVINHMYNSSNEDDPSWYNPGYWSPFYASNIEAADGIVYKFYNIWDSDPAPGENPGRRLYNKTDEAAVANTEHHNSTEEYLFNNNEDAITAPDDGDEIGVQSYGFATYDSYLKEIFAYMTENFEITGYLPADASQPTGYHCFMSQFIKNSIAGYVPILTPDAVNRCW